MERIGRTCRGYNSFDITPNWVILEPNLKDFSRGTIFCETAIPQKLTRSARKLASKINGMICVKRGEEKKIIGVKNVRGMEEYL